MNSHTADLQIVVILSDVARKERSLTTGGIIQSKTGIDMLHTPSLAILLTTATLALSVSVGFASASVVTFDDATNLAEVAIPNGYLGFTWDNFAVISPYSAAFNPSGYVNGKVSQNYVGFNWYGNPAIFSSPNSFTINSLYMTAAWRDGLSVKLEGRRNGVVVDTTTYSIATSSPTFVTLNYQNIDTFSVFSSGGVNAGFNGDGTQVVFDNITYNMSSVPLPAAAPMFGLAILALGGVGFGMRRRKFVAAA